jgi:hypothetical protein
MSKRVSFIAMSAALVAAACATTQNETAAASCDRACLEGAITVYLDAMAANDTSRLPLVEGVRFTEDGVDLELGEGLWAEGATFAGYRFDVLDVREGQAASLVKLEAAGSPVLLALRLKVEPNGAITEIETMAVRNQIEGMIFRPEQITMVSEAMTLTPPAGSLNTREAMIDAATRYPKGLQVGSFVTSDVPFTADAYRFENGQLMAGPGCTFFEGCTDIKTQRIPTLAGLKYYVAAVDEEQGVVLIRMDFGPGSLFPSPDRPAGQTLSVFEAFKVYDGQVHAVEAFMEAKPGDAPLGWEPAES